VALGSLATKMVGGNNCLG